MARRWKISSMPRSTGRKAGATCSPPPGPPNTSPELPRFATEGLLSPTLGMVGDQIVDFWRTVDINQLGGAVSWAGPGPAPVWLDAARDFTEYWIHQQQIAEATGHPGLTQPDYLGPVLDTFLRGLPHTLRDATAGEGATLEFTVTGPAGGTWTCTRTGTRWAPDHDQQTHPDARVELDADTTWRLCTRGITPSRPPAEPAPKETTDSPLRH